MRNCENKYSVLTNTYEPRRIVMTCINVMLEIYRKDDHASFGFIGSNLVEEKGTDNTKRFRFYKRIMATYFSEKYFIHQENSPKSAYLMLNKAELANNPRLKEDIEDAFGGQYEYFD